MFLKDTDGDGKADDRKTIILHGFDTADSHHAIHAFTWDPGGALYLQEGTFHYSQVETPYGPQRAATRPASSGTSRRPRSSTSSSPTGSPTPGATTSTAGARTSWPTPPAAPTTSAPPSPARSIYPDKHGRMKQFLVKQWRPTCGCELVSSRNFPDDTQGDYLLNNDIGFQGVLRYRVKEDGSGFKADPVEPLLTSSDPNFRPVDLEFGPDGALYVVDWFNPLVGHMQHSLRDPNRDVEHGRIWRITYKGRPLVEPAKIAGATVPELLDLLKAYEDRTRYRARRELRERPASEVMAAARRRWVAGAEQDRPRLLAPHARSPLAPAEPRRGRRAAARRRC